jgi:hypothetical protein
MIAVQFTYMVSTSVLHGLAQFAIPSQVASQGTGVVHNADVAMYWADYTETSPSCSQNKHRFSFLS